MAVPTVRRAGDAGFRLEPQEAVEVAGDRMAATSQAPWLRVEPVDLLVRRRWVRLRYELSYFDDPVRPMIRFDTADGRRFVQFMNGPVLGAGEWIGRIPDRTTAISVSPVNEVGPFDFRLVGVEDVARHRLARRGLTYDRDALLLAVGAKIINAKEERWELLKFAGSATPFEDYAAWHRRLYRPIDLDGLDRPRCDWRTAPVVRLVLPLERGGVEALRATVDTLRSQLYTRWSLCGVTSSETPHDVLAAFRAAMAQDTRIAEASADAPLATLAAEGGAGDAIGIVDLGGLLPEYALAVLADGFARQPSLRLAYSDEDSISAQGALHSPLFKPDWSPIFFSGLPCLGRLACVRAGDLATLGLQTLGEFCRREATAFGNVAKSGGAGVRHIRRVLYRQQRPPDAAAARPEIIAAPQRPLADETSSPEVAIVIPTRDRADLLQRCVESLRRLTDHPRYRLVIVDNGSRKADALALLRELAKSLDCQVLNAPGPFNFSALCNAGARASASPVLVFLNNDIVVAERGWLGALVRWAIRPEIGVVGAKLVFPDNKIEHAGVVLGHGSLAGHIYHRQPSDQAGYLGQLLVPREVEAATGACFAIERTKFDAIGGFDENLKVEFNDIDLCLKAAERGWTTVWTPEAMLYHRQSASRGYPLKPHQVFRDERDYFLKRWAHVIRDDRYFHPALSLFSHKPALA